jgi:hypothetical protein
LSFSNVGSCPAFSPGSNIKQAIALANPPSPIFNLDGDLDVAVATCYIPRDSVLLGNGDGTLAPFKEYPTQGGCPESTQTADMNNDSIPDIQVANYGALYVGAVSVLIGNGDGTFKPPLVAYLPDNVNDLVVRDFNADGFQDAAVINYTDHRVFVLLGNGDGTLKHTSTLSTGLDPIDMASGDFNNDGAFDFAVANQGSDSFSVFLGNGNGTFKPKVDYFSGGDFANGIAVADLDGDRIPEVVVSNSRSNIVAVFKAVGDGTFKSLYSVRVRRAPTGVSVGDYNRDGLSDIAVSCQGPFPYPAAVTILLNKDANSLMTHSILPSPKTSHLVSGDRSLVHRAGCAVGERLCGEF